MFPFVRGCPNAENNEIYCLREDRISKRWMVHDTPSKTYDMVYLPVSKHPTRSETRNENLHGPQMAVTSSRLEPSNGSWSQCADDRKLHNHDVLVICV